MAEAAMQGANQLIRSNLGFSILLKDILKCSQAIQGIRDLLITGQPTLPSELQLVDVYWNLFPITELKLIHCMKQIANIIFP